MPKKEAQKLPEGTVVSARTNQRMELIIVTEIYGMRFYMNCAELY